MEIFSLLVPSLLLNIFAQIVPGVTWCILSSVDFPCNRVRVRVIWPVPRTRNRGILRSLMLKYAPWTLWPGYNIERGRGGRNVKIRHWKTHAFNETGLFRKVSQLLLSMIVAPWAGKDDPNPALWLATPAGKMALSCPLGATRCAPLVWIRWLDIGLVLFCEFIDLESVSVYKQAKKEKFGQYPDILTSRLVNAILTGKECCVANNISGN